MLDGVDAEAVDAEVDPVLVDVDEPVDGPLTVTVYPGADGAFAMYEDDGRSFGYRNGAWMKLALSWTEASRRLTLRLAEGSQMLPPMKRVIEVRVAGPSAGRRLEFIGAPVDVKL